MKGPDYILDISGLTPNPPGAARPERGAASDSEKRRWLAVSWKCCSVYSRIYVNRKGTAYEGRCPKCGKPVRATIGPGGTTARFFEAE